MSLDSYGSPEIARLMAASRGDPTREPVRRLMARRINWRELTRLAIESHATPGLWQVVSSYPNLPPEARELQSVAVLNDFRRHHIRTLTARVTSQLAAHGIEVLALKGAALLAGGVTRPSQRTMSDIDLLVTKGSPETAWHVCRTNGWTLVDTAWTEDLYKSHHHLAPLLDPEGVNVGLELHRKLLSSVERLGLNVGEILARSRTVDVAGVPVRVPSVEDLLLHSCLHFAWSNKLQRGAWRAYADVNAILADPSFAWERFLPLAHSRRARQCCYWTLRLGRVVADLPVPDEALRQLDPSAGGRFARKLEMHFAMQIADPREENVIAQRARRWLWFAAMREPVRSAEADELWNEGAVEVPGEGVAPKPKRRVQTAFATSGHVWRLLLRR
ncbi:MAG TPA: nucleotidyltransferase family protein [Gemmatimonadaceae bacterium]